MSKPLAKVRRRKSKTAVKPNADSGAVLAPEYYSKSIGRALDILEYFPTPETTLNLVEIVKLSGIPESSLFRILLTLEHHGYLARGADGTFRLTPRVLFGLLHEQAEKLRVRMRPFLQELNQRFNETVSLAYLFGDKIQVIDVLEAFQDVRATNVSGKILPPHCSSMAKAITAFQPQEIIDRIVQIYGLVRFTDKTIVDRLKLFGEYEHIRDRGWSMEREESSVGICCIGVPVFNEKNHAVAAFSVMTPLMRLNPEKEERIIEELLETSRRASSNGE